MDNEEPAVQRARPGMGWGGVGCISGRATSMPRRNSWANQRDQKESWVVGCGEQEHTSARNPDPWFKNIRLSPGEEAPGPSGLGVEAERVVAGSITFHGGLLNLRWSDVTK